MGAGHDSFRESTKLCTAVWSDWTELVLNRLTVTTPLVSATSISGTVYAGGGNDTLSFSADQVLSSVVLVQTQLSSLAVRPST